MIPLKTSSSVERPAGRFKLEDEGVVCEILKVLVELR